MVGEETAHKLFLSLQFNIDYSEILCTLNTDENQLIFSCNKTMFYLIKRTAVN